MSVILTDKIQPRTTGIALTVVGDTNVSGALTCTNFTASGDVSIGGTLTYEDVTNIDSVGLITARTGVRVTAGGVVVTAGVSTFTDDVKVNSTLTATEGLNVTAGIVTVNDYIQHAGDTNTAIRFPAADTVTVETGGSEVVRADSSQNFGVGTASPTARLDVRRGDTDGKIAEFHQSAGYGIDIGSSQALAYISSGYNQNWAFKTDAGSGQVERLRIESGGDVGINTSNPTVKLDISEDGVAFPCAAGSTLLRLRNSGGSATLSIDAGASSNSVIQFGDTAAASVGTIQYSHVTNHLQFNTNGDGEKMRIESGGNIGIGTDNPNNLLHVYGGIIKSQSNPTNTGTDVELIRAQSGSGGGAVLSIRAENAADDNSNWDIKTNANEDLTFTIGGATERARITSSGDVQIGDGTVAAEAPLHVTAENSQGINAIFGAKDFIVDDQYNYDDANIALQGRDKDDNETGAGVQFTVRNTGNNNWLHGAFVLDRESNYHLYRGVGNTDGTKELTINSTGGVGIGTTNFASDVDNRPGLAIHSDSNDSCRLLLTTPTKAPTRLGYFGLNRFGMDVHHGFQIRDVADSYATRMIINSSGYMGIHNTSPATWLHINRDDQQDDAHQSLKIENTGTNTAFNAGLAVKNYQGTSQFMQWTTSGLRMGSRLVTNTGNGHVSITRGGDDVALTIDGANGNFSGSSSANISDGRLKKNIVGITSATATLKQLVGKTFNWIPESKLDTKTKYGFIAQEVKSVIPDLVYQDLSINRVSTASTAQDYGKGIIIDDNSADFSDDSKSEWSMSVETNGIVPILVEAFKELDARISALESS